MWLTKKSFIAVRSSGREGSCVHVMFNYNIASCTLWWQQLNKSKSKFTCFCLFTSRMNKTMTTMCTDWTLLKVYIEIKIKTTWTSKDQFTAETKDDKCFLVKTKFPRAIIKKTISLKTPQCWIGPDYVIKVRCKLWNIASSRWEHFVCGRLNNLSREVYYSGNSVVETLGSYIRSLFWELYSHKPGLKKLTLWSRLLNVLNKAFCVAA